jgi:small subunit ribosomal protein S20
MAHTRSAIKRIRQAERRRVRNQMIKSRVKTLIKRARTLIEAGELEQARLSVGDAISALDRAAERGILHRNNAARRKSRLVKRYNTAFTSPAATA